MNPNTLKQEREKIYTELYNNIIPERFPVHDSLTWNYLIEYSGKDLMEVQYRYDPDECIEIMEKAYADEVLTGDNQISVGGHWPISLMLQECRQSVVGTTGMIQHPEREYMFADEYDEFINNPYDFFLEKISTRTNYAYSRGEVARQFAFTKWILSQNDFGKKLSKINKTISEKYGYWAPPAGSGNHQYIPFDFIADHCRGFSKIPVDLRRQPEKVIAACEALMPMCLWTGMNKVQTNVGSNLIPTHMAAYLKTKDFEKFYWPTFKAVVHKTAERGQAMSIFIENDWDRYIDYLDEMPMGTRMYMEYGNPKKFKDKLGKKHILSGFYPLTLFKTGTKEQCIDKAKEIIDVMAPGGNYYFLCDKNALTLGDINIDNYKATMQYVQKNNKNDNAGTLVNSTLKREDTIDRTLCEKYTIDDFKSKYVVSFEEFKQDFPPVDQKIECYMKEAYYKYQGLLRLQAPHNL